MKQILRISIIAFLVSTVWSQTTGKISGTVTGDDGTPLVGANVVVLGTGSGASSNADGEFQIINVPAGSYVLKATYIGYTSQEVSGVRVISGLSTPVDLSLSTSSIEGDVVQVVAEKPLIQKDETSSVNVVTGDQLENMPIRTLDGVLATMPGVVVQNGDVHIRGGRDNEVAYYLNGASTTNLANRENLVYVPQEAIEELQVQVGGYDAEVSGANSGVVKRSLKTGTDSFSGSFSLQTDGSGAGEAALLGDGFSYGHQTVLASVSGPIMPGLKFFVALEQSQEEDPYVKVANKFEFLQQADEQPSNSAYPDMFDITWKDGVTPGSDDEFTNLTGTVTYDAGPLRATLGMVNNFSTNNYGGGIMSQLRWGGATIGTADADGAFVDSAGSLLSPYNVPGRYVYEDAGSNLMTGELTYALSSNTVLRASVSSYSEERETQDNWFGNDWEKWHDSTAVANYLGFPAVNDSTPAWSPFKSRFSEKTSYMVNGMSFSRPGTRPANYSKSAYSKTGFSASVQHVMGAHDIKAGVSYNQHSMRRYAVNPSIMKYALDSDTALAKYGHNGYGTFADIPAYEWRNYIDGYGYDHNGAEQDDRTFYIGAVPGVANNDTTYLDGAKKPTEMGFYLQDKMEFDDLVVNLGVRIDQLDPSETAPANANELYFYNVSKYVDPTTWKEVETYTEIQPRIGISFPFTDRTNVYGYYGRFSQLVDLNSMYFTAMDYRNQMNTGGYFYPTPVGFGSRASSDYTVRDRLSSRPYPMMLL
ncbi:MAG: carboxypeptidase regulatory-like domain-containing protein [Candidatus Neomarinimicrobiota bacterium]